MPHFLAAHEKRGRRSTPTQILINLDKVVSVAEADDGNALVFMEGRYHVLDDLTVQQFRVKVGQAGFLGS